VDPLSLRASFPNLQVFNNIIPKFEEQRYHFNRQYPPLVLLPSSESESSTAINEIDLRELGLFPGTVPIEDVQTWMKTWPGLLTLDVSLCPSSAPILSNDCQDRGIKHTTLRNFTLRNTDFLAMRDIYLRCPALVRLQLLSNDLNDSNLHALLAGDSLSLSLSLSLSFFLFLSFFFSLSFSLSLLSLSLSLSLSRSLLSLFLSLSLSHFSLSLSLSPSLSRSRSLSLSSSSYVFFATGAPLLEELTVEFYKDAVGRLPTNGMQLINPTISCENIHSLVMRNCLAVTSITLDACCTALTTITCDGLSSLTDEGIQSWQELPSIDTIALQSCTLLRSPMFHSRTLRNLQLNKCPAAPSLMCPQLEILEVSDGEYPTELPIAFYELLIERLVEGCPKLRSLVWRPAKIPDVPIENKAAGLDLPHLAHLELAFFPIEFLSSLHQVALTLVTEASLLNTVNY